MNDFDTRYQPVYRAIFDFHKQHYGANTAAQFKAAAMEAGDTFADVFEAALAAAVYNELGRDAK